MARPKSSTPSYRHHRASGQAVVTIAGKEVYLGPWKSAASRHEYDRVVGEWLARGRIAPPNPSAGITVGELLADYLRWAKGYYRGGSREVEQIKFTIRPLRKLYGKTPASQFGPLALKAVREEMIKANICRNEINKRVGRLKRIFAWGVENERVPASVHHGLQAVRGLSRGRSDARESAPVKPVPEPFVDAIESHVVPQVWAMVQLQRLTGMRPGEVTTMRTCDIDATGNVWIYTPARHKTQYHGHSRQIHLGPRAQAVLKPWLRTQFEEYLFQPQEAAQWILERRRANRKTPLSCGNKPGSNRKRKPKRVPSHVYQVGAYGRAIRRGCEKADVPHWHPHQLRHNAATWLRKEFGLDAARVILGHRSPAITEVYAELDAEKAAEIMGRVG